MRHAGQHAEEREDAATGVQVLGRAELAADLAGRSWFEVTRVTIAAAAIESSSAGTCATSASPIASRI
jgi:hypothetical protein